MVEKIGPGYTFGGWGKSAAVEKLMNGHAEEGWEFVESHLAPDGDGRYYVFARELPTRPLPTG
jgi:hypothetical protein